MRSTILWAALLWAALALLLAAPPGRAADDPMPAPDPFEEAMRRMDDFRRMLDMPGFKPARRSAPPRLGVEVRVPDAALAEQLELPREQGLVLAGIAPGSAAEKAGMKKNDILLEMAGKPVPARPAEFVKMVAGLEAGKPLDAVVLRKGRKETLKGVKLPETKPRLKDEVIAEPLPALPALPGLPALGLDLKVPFDALKGKAMTVIRTDDNFTATQKDGDTTVTVKGTVDQGKAKVEAVVVEGKDGKKTYAPDKVPEAYRMCVEALGKLAAGETR